MGQLVFQATLGGAVNLIGPNIAGTVNFTLPSADGSSGQAISTNGSGVLSFGTLGILGGGTGQTSYTNGQLLIGNTTGNTLTKATLTAGTGITITNGTGSITIASSGGSGDVVGPASAIANSIALFNSTTGKLIKDSSASDGLIYGLTVGRGSGAIASNMAVGVSALGGGSQTGIQNTAVGYQALSANTSGGYNTAFGFTAMRDNTTGEQNAAFGREALQLNISGIYNTACGMSALRVNLTGNNNSAFGFQALAANTASNNTALGYQSLQANVSAANNTAVGYQSLYTNQTGGSLTAIGYQALYSNTGSITTAVGYQALYTNSSAQYNTALGYKAGFNASTGSGENTYLGHEAGGTHATGNSCIFIGSQSKSSSTSVNAEYLIGQNLTGKGTGTFFAGGLNGAYNQGNTTTWTTTSDQRLKKNIVDNNDGLDKINSICVRNFEYRTEEEVTELPTHAVIKKQGVQLGVIAQELQAVLPDCVKQESTGVLTVNSDNLVWYLVNAVKQLKVEIDELKGNI